MRFTRILNETCATLFSSLHLFTHPLQDNWANMQMTTCFLFPFEFSGRNENWWTSKRSWVGIRANKHEGIASICTFYVYEATISSDLYNSKMYLVYQGSSSGSAAAEEHQMAGNSSKPFSQPMDMNLWIKPSRLTTTSLPRAKYDVQIVGINQFL